MHLRKIWRLSYGLLEFCLCLAFHLFPDHYFRREQARLCGLRRDTKQSREGAACSVRIRLSQVGNSQSIGELSVVRSPVTGFLKEQNGFAIVVPEIVTQTEGGHGFPIIRSSFSSGN